MNFTTSIVTVVFIAACGFYVLAVGLAILAYARYMRLLRRLPKATRYRKLQQANEQLERESRKLTEQLRTSEQKLHELERSRDAVEGEIQRLRGQREVLLELEAEIAARADKPSRGRPGSGRAGQQTPAPDYQTKVNGFTVSETSRIRTAEIPDVHDPTRDARDIGPAAESAGTETEVGNAAASRRAPPDTAAEEKADPNLEEKAAGGALDKLGQAFGSRVQQAISGLRRHGESKAAEKRSRQETERE